MSATLAPPPRSRSPLAGCLIGCLSLIVGITALLGLVYFVIWYSPLPLRIIVNSLDTEDNTWSVKGINGSLARGFEIEEIDFPGETSEDPSVHLKELTLKYEDVFDMFADEHVLIKEISVKQAEFVISPDWFRDEETPPTEEEDETEETSPEPTPDQPSPSRPPSFGAAAPQFELQTLDLQNIQIRATDDSFEVRIPQIRVKDFNLETRSLSLQELVLQDFSVRSAELDPDLAIPAIRVVGLAIDEDTFDLSELVVNSNIIEVEFREVEPRQLGDHVIPYEGRIRGVVSAEIHPILLQSFDLETEFAPTADRLLVRSAGFDVGHTLIYCCVASLQHEYYACSAFFCIFLIYLSCTGLGHLVDLQELNLTRHRCE